MPNLVIEESEQQTIGKYGRMRKRYLKDHRPVLYSNLLTAGKLYRHLAEIDEASEERVDLLTRRMAKQEGVTESLKAADQMEWVSVLPCLTKTAMSWCPIRRMSRPTAPSFAARCKVMKPACAVIVMPVNGRQKCTAPTFTAVTPD
ncbi:MAG: TnpV protein [Oscillospiraceae bacterium]|nr:TnpV protein [Oscillospiraceae bacterium]